MEIVKKYKMKNFFFILLYEICIINVELKYFVMVDEFCIIIFEGECDVIVCFCFDVLVMGWKISIGMKIGNNVIIFNDLLLYIDILFVVDKSSYLKLLLYCYCMIVGIFVEIKGGIEYDFICLVSEKYDFGRLIMEEIISKYVFYYLILKVYGLKVRDLLCSRVFEEIFFLLLSDFIVECDVDIVWIDIEFFIVFLKEILEQVKVQMNIFIVVNKYLVKIIRKVDFVLVIFFLEKMEFEYFLFVDLIIDNYGDWFREIFGIQDEGRVGCYLVRRGGCECFNVMDVKDFLNCLIDLLYDESMVFFLIDKDGMKEVIEQIEEWVN